MLNTAALCATLHHLSCARIPTWQAWSAKRKALLPSISFSSGSFFDAGKIPAATSNSDVFTLRQILHDWSDADSLKILKQVRGSMNVMSGTAGKTP